jgi:hypothetical protein
MRTRVVKRSRAAVRAMPGRTCACDAARPRVHSFAAKVTRSWTGGSLAAAAPAALRAEIGEA